MVTASKPSLEKQSPVATTVPHRPWWQATFELALLTVVAILALELIFRFCGVGGQEFLEPDPALGCRQIPGKQVTWRLEGFSNDTLNSTGRRDVEHSLTKPAGLTRIAILGDSATEGLQVPLENTYCRVLEQMLNCGSRKQFEVLNFGCSSYSTGQQVLQFEQQVERYKPDITVLLYVRGAALQNTYNPYKRVAEPRPYFYMDKAGQLQEDDSVLREQASAMQPNMVLSFLRKNSRIYGVFCQTNLSLSIHEKLYHKFKGWFTAIADKLTGHTHGKETRLLYMPQDPWPVTKALLERLNKDCSEHGSRLVVMIFPNTTNDPILAVQITALESISKADHFGLIDLTPAFKASKDVQALFLQYHFSSAGHKLTAEQLAAYLAKH